MKRFLITAALTTTYLTATPVTHSYFGKTWIESNCPEYSDEDTSAFYKGLWFPDIKYMQVISEKEVDVRGVTLEQIRSAATPFESGRLLHAFINDEREKCAKEWGIYEELERFPEEHVHLYLKLIEDQLLYDEIDISTLRNHLYSIHPEEEGFNLPYQTIKTWHRVLTQYYSMRPAKILRRLRQYNLGLFGVTVDEIALWSRNIVPITEEVTMQTYMADLTDHFNRVFTP